MWLYTCKQQHVLWVPTCRFQKWALGIFLCNLVYNKMLCSHHQSPNTGWSLIALMFGSHLWCNLILHNVGMASLWQHICLGLGSCHTSLRVRWIQFGKVNTPDPWLAGLEIRDKVREFSQISFENYARMFVDSRWWLCKNGFSDSLQIYDLGSLANPPWYYYFNT